MTRLKLISVSLLISVLSVNTVVADDDAPRTALKVCADPNYQPFSSKDLSGYENRIAAIIGESLNLPVEYTWFPQRMGFIRSTLRKENPDGKGHLCDLVIGVPKGFGMAATSKPYLRSTYGLVVSTAGKLAPLESAQQFPELAAKTDGLRVAVTERSPGSELMAKYGLFDEIAPYIAQSGDPNEFPGQPMLEDLLAGKVDAAIVWGPTAAHFVRTAGDKLKMFPLASEAGVRFDYEISAAVRYGEDEWEEQVNRILEENAPKIQAIMEEYGIPVVKSDG